MTVPRCCVPVVASEPAQWRCPACAGTGHVPPGPSTGIGSLRIRRVPDMEPPGRPADSHPSPGQRVQPAAARPRDQRQRPETDARSGSRRPSGAAAPSMPEQQEERGAAEAANQDVAVHCLSSLRFAHATNDQPNAQPDEQQRPAEFEDASADFVQLTQQQQQSQADENDGANGLLAPPERLRRRRNRGRGRDPRARPPGVNGAAW